MSHAFLATYSPANSWSSSDSLSRRPLVFADLTIWTKIGANSPSSANNPLDGVSNRYFEAALWLVDDSLSRFSLV